MALVYYKGGIIRGLSSDTKPTTIPTNTLFIETDTLKFFLFNGSIWVEFIVGVGSNSIGDSQIDSHTTTKITVPYSKLSIATSIVNGDISASAAIAKSKLAALNIVNADVDAAAGITYSKLSLGNSIVNADIAGGAAIAKSKLAALDIVNSDVNVAAAIAYSKLSLTGSIVNADISNSAAIASSKLAAKEGSSTQSGNGTTTTFTIAHGFGSEPGKVFAISGSEDAIGSFWVSKDATNITVNYVVAPPSGTDNLIWYWRAS